MPTPNQQKQQQRQQPTVKPGTPGAALAEAIEKADAATAPEPPAQTAQASTETTAPEQPRVIKDEPKELIDARKVLAGLIASGKRQHIGAVKFTVPKAERTAPRAIRGGKLRLVAEGGAVLNEALAPDLFAPVRVYRRLLDGQKNYTVEINFKGVGGGAGAPAAWWTAGSGNPADVRPAAAGLLEVIRAEYNIWRHSPDATLPSLMEASKAAETAPDNGDGDAADF